MKGLWLTVSLLGWIGLAAAQSQALTLRDLESKNPRKLSKDEVTQLMTGAKITRVSSVGNVTQWTNEPSGNFVASAENRDKVGARPSTASGKWHISDDGRYCVLIEWTRAPTEEWCRLVFDTSDGHYTSRSDSVGSERVFKLDIKK